MTTQYEIIAWFGVFTLACIVLMMIDSTRRMILYNRNYKRLKGLRQQQAYKYRRLEFNDPDHDEDWKRV